MKEKNIKIISVNEWVGKDEESYQLLDTGGGEKLEKFGKYTFVRPYEEAVWSKTLSKKEWENIDGKFLSSRVGGKGGWKLDTKIKDKWVMSHKDIKFLAFPTPFRHFGFFPEQVSHWEFIEEKIKNSPKPIKFLNLFGYTGVASLFALRAGGDVTHIDASSSSIEWAKENQKLNNHLGLENLPMRVMVEDVKKFLEREGKRGNKYDAIIMDPPKFGRGPKGEIWKLERDLPTLLSQIKKILSDNPLFVIINSYAVESSALSLGYLLEEMMSSFSGDIVTGELCLKEKSKDRYISLSNTAIWSSK